MGLTSFKINMVSKLATPITHDISKGIPKTKHLFRFLKMEIDVEDIESLDPPEEKRGNPGAIPAMPLRIYRRKWDTYNRADMDGGSYSEIVEVPHCIKCDHSMLLISTSRKTGLVCQFSRATDMGCRFTLCGVILFEFTFSSFTGLLIHGCICYLLSRLPKKIQTHSFKLEKKQKKKMRCGSFYKKFKRRF